MHRSVEARTKNGQVWPLLSVAGVVCLFLGSFASQAQQASQGSTQPSMAQSGAASNLPIAAGDLLVITVLDTPDLSGMFRVSPQGTINLQQGGAITVGGMAPLQAAQQIEGRLRDGEIMLDPHVTVLVQEYGSSGVVVLGQVNRPGTYTLLGEHSLYGALAAAGGTGPDLGQSIIVSHQNDPTSKEVIDISTPNYSDRVRATTVNPGDTVIVSRGKEFYVYGDVNHPGVFSMGTRPIHLLEALSLAEGVDRIAAARKGSILRKTDTGVQLIPIDLKRIVKNQDPNPVLEASDIVYIPRSLAKALFFQALPGITSSAAGAGITSAILR